MRLCLNVVSLLLPHRNFAGPVLPKIKNQSSINILVIKSNKCEQYTVKYGLIYCYQTLGAAGCFDYSSCCFYCFMPERLLLFAKIAFTMAVNLTD